VIYCDLYNVSLVHMTQALVFL